MVLIDTYRGSPDELAAFVNRVWEHSYAEKMTFPRWTPEFFQWQFRIGERENPQNLLAACEGETLVGVLLGADYSFRSPAGIHSGSHWSWLSVHPEHRGKGIAKALDEERVRRQRAAGSRLVVSYRYVGSRHSLAERPDRNSPSKKFHRKVGFWARVLNPPRFSRWNSNRLEGWLARLAAPMAHVPRTTSSDSIIREFATEDLDACLRLVAASYSSMMLAIHWDRDLLRHQLCGSPVGQTLILEENGSISGLVNFHILPFQDRSVENVGLFDLIAFGEGSVKSQVRLINAALTRMVTQDVILALKIRCGDAAVWPMIRARFIPQPAESFLVLQWIGDPVEIPSTAPVHVLWR